MHTASQLGFHLNQSSTSELIDSSSIVLKPGYFINLVTEKLWKTKSLARKSKVLDVKDETTKGSNIDISANLFCYVVIILTRHVGLWFCSTYALF